jgi:hypothetical protein
MGVIGDIHFYIGDAETVETGTYVMGAFVEKDLTITHLPSDDPSPYCGDGSCNNGETCSSCSTDCGSCNDGDGDDNDDDDDDDNGGGGGGGSSGGDSSDVIILSNPNVDSSSSGGSSTPFITGNSIKSESGFFDLFTSGALLMALIIAVIVLGLIVLFLPSKR